MLCPLQRLLTAEHCEVLQSPTLYFNWAADLVCAGVIAQRMPLATIEVCQKHECRCVNSPKRAGSRTDAKLQSLYIARCARHKSCRIWHGNREHAYDAEDYE